MNRIITTLLTLTMALLMTTQAVAQTAPAPTLAEVTRERDALAEQNAKLRARVAELEAKYEPDTSQTEGFRGIPWGASAKKTRKEHGDKLTPVEENKVGYILADTDEEIANKDGALGYMMDREHGLYAVSWIYGEKHSNDNLFISAYDNLASSLSSKYGEGEASADWSNELYRNEPSRHGMAVSVGHLALKSRWETEDTIIILSLKGDNFDCTLSLMYLSKDLFILAREREEAARRENF